MLNDEIKNVFCPLPGSVVASLPRRCGGHWRGLGTGMLGSAGRMAALGMMVQEPGGQDVTSAPATGKLYNPVQVT